MLQYQRICTEQIGKGKILIQYQRMETIWTCQPLSKKDIVQLSERLERKISKTS
jgi:hypothetical protein